jgi:UV DNA damage endonuclease
MRLGFAVKVLGRPELKSHDTRRWQSGPHLSVSLRYLRDILAYLHEAGIRMRARRPPLAASGPVHRAEFH